MYVMTKRFEVSKYTWIKLATVMIYYLKKKNLEYQSYTFSMQ